jgi:hypothetical protein
MLASKRLFALSGLTAMLGALALAAPAKAALKAQCVVDGEVKAHTTKPVFTKYVQLLGGSGTYAFMGFSIICLDLGAAKAPGTVHIGPVAATGTFTDEIALPGGGTTETPCGQGKVTGVVTAQGLAPKFAAILGAKFAIEFGPPYGPLGTGAFFWHTAGPPAKVPDKPPTVPKLLDPAVVKPYRYAGTVQLSLSDRFAKDPVADLVKRLSTAPDDKCIKSFHVNGAVTVHE